MKMRLVKRLFESSTIFLPLGTQHDSSRTEKKEDEKKRKRSEMGQRDSHDNQMTTGFFRLEYVLAG